jgi:hypothetical protein
MYFLAFKLTYCYKMQTRFKDFDYNMKVYIKEQFHQFAVLETSFMHPPRRKVNTKDSRKKDKLIVQLTKRSPSLCEHFGSHDPDTQAT